MSGDKKQELVEMFKVLSDRTRLNILHLLFTTDKTLCVNEIADAVGATSSATSHQLAKLEAKDIVSCSRMGQTMCYVIKDNALTRCLHNALFACQLCIPKEQESVH